MERWGWKMEQSKTRRSRFPLTIQMGYRVTRGLRSRDVGLQRSATGNDIIKPSRLFRRLLCGLKNFINFHKSSCRKQLIWRCPASAHRIIRLPAPHSRNVIVTTGVRHSNLSRYHDYNGQTLRPLNVDGTLEISKNLDNSERKTSDLVSATNSRSFQHIQHQISQKAVNPLPNPLHSNPRVLILLHRTEKNQFLQVNFTNKMKIRRIAVQGCGFHNQTNFYVRKLSVYHSDDGTMWRPYKEGFQTKVRLDSRASARSDFREQHRNFLKWFLGLTHQRVYF